MTTDVKVDSVELIVNKRHAVSGDCSSRPQPILGEILIRFDFKLILQPNDIFSDMSSLSKLYLLRPLYNPLKSAIGVPKHSTYLH